MAALSCDVELDGVSEPHTSEVERERFELSMGQ
jgi:hypothetical protein